MEPHTSKTGRVRYPVLRVQALLPPPDEIATARKPRLKLNFGNGCVIEAGV
jgi:hypothetical protein